MAELASELRQPLIELLLSIADDKFILGSRNSDWTGLAPILEEDIAFSALAQDDIAHASALYEFIGPMVGKSSDQLAFGREPGEYRCASITVLEDEFNWAVAIGRQFLCDHFESLRLQRLARTNFEPLAEIARRMLAEESIHIGHADQWLVRLGKGDDEARGKLQAALDLLAPHAVMLFEPTAGLEQLESAGVYPPLPQDMFATWKSAIESTTTESGLRCELKPADAKTRGGRAGVHADAFAPLLDELTEVYRTEPAAAW